jgi:medium-chain acyl-[acyl-carrier-protein] hydrolase
VNQAWIQRYRPLAEPQLRLFCFPYAGVGAAVYRLWPAGLPASVEMCAVVLPGREARLREAPLRDIAPMVEGAAAALLPYTDRPYALFGHSMGSVLAFETSRRLAAQGQRPPSHLFVSGRRAPSTVERDVPIADLPDREFALEINRRYGGIPPEVLEDAEVLALLLPALRADLAALDRYHPAPSPPLAWPLTVYGGTDDARATREQLEAWRLEAGAAFRLRLFPGGHFYLANDRDALLADLSSALRPLLRADTMSGALA